MDFLIQNITSDNPISGVIRLTVSLRMVMRVISLPTKLAVMLIKLLQVNIDLSGSHKFLEYGPCIQELLSFPLHQGTLLHG